jgi:pimeloyl-ACP methyl ester carboxylesterase/putative sterol carrier protein
MAVDVETRPEGVEQVPAGEVLAHLPAVCAEDVEFGRRARYVQGAVRFGIGDEGFLLRFYDGRLVDVRTDADQTITWDYEVVGPRVDWERMWTGEIDLTQALVPLFGSTQVRGDRVKYATDVEAIVHITRILRVAAERAGVAVLPARPPAPPAPPDAWRTTSEVVGRYVEVDGARTYYETVGDAEGPVTFLAVHTAGRDCRQWQQIGDVLGQAGRFISFDLPGHSKSWPLPGNRVLGSMQEMSDFTWKLRAALGIDQPTVVMGCSVGGNLVFQLAGDHPDDVAAMISLQGADYSPTQPEAARALMDHPMVNPAYHHIDRTISLTGDRTPQHVRDYLEWEIRLYSSPTIYADLTAYTNFDYRDRMGQITCPSLLIRGLADWIVSQDMVDGSAARLVNAPAVEVLLPEGVGHFAHYEQPVELGHQVLDFLRRTGVVA